MKKNFPILTLVVVLVLFDSFMASTHDVYKHHNYTELTAVMQDLARRFPQNTYLYSIGKSAQNRELWVMAIAERDPDIHVLLRPEAKYVANMHGNEVVGRELLLILMDYMLTNQNDPNVAYIMKVSLLNY
jgi:carboxypeptidase M